MSPDTILNGYYKWKMFKIQSAPKYILEWNRWKGEQEVREGSLKKTKLVYPCFVNDIVSAGLP